MLLPVETEKRDGFKRPRREKTNNTCVMEKERGAKGEEALSWLQGLSLCSGSSPGMTHTETEH